MKHCVLSLGVSYVDKLIMVKQHAVRHYKSFVDLTGKVFVRWTVLRYSHRKSGILYWDCRCDCGHEKKVIGQSLKNGRSKSCGCLSRELSSNRERTHGISNADKSKFGYHCWSQMKSRCSDPSANGFMRYGGRGITVCDSWKSSFMNFISDMGPRPSVKHSIDRIDVNGNYEPSNCRWASHAEQSRNKRTNNNFTANSETMCIKDWADRLATTPGTITQRLSLGWSIQDAITKPVNHKGHLIKFGGEYRTICEWSCHLSIPYATIKSRLRRGWTIERTFSTPSRGSC